MSTNTRGAALVRAIETCIHPDDGAIAALGEIFTDDVTVWSPTLFAVGVADLAENLALREPAFSDVAIQITSLGVLGNKGFAEFQVAATFSGPFVINETVAIEPNGRTLVLGAAAIADYDGDKIKAVRAYFDDATLLEQMLSEKV
jgi:hypothetical protein